MHQKLFIKQDFSDSEVEKAPLFSIDCVAFFVCASSVGKACIFIRRFPHCVTNLVETFVLMLASKLKVAFSDLSTYIWHCVMFKC